MAGLWSCGAEPGPSGQLTKMNAQDATVTTTITPDAGMIDAGFDPCPKPQLASIQEKTLIPSCGVSGCHIGTASTAAGLDLTLEVEALRLRLSQSSTQSPSRMKLIEPGRFGSSWLYLKIAFPQPVVGEQMPPGQSLDKCEIDAISDWIRAGASD